MILIFGLGSQLVGPGLKFFLTPKFLALVLQIRFDLPLIVKSVRQDATKLERRQVLVQFMAVCVAKIAQLHLMCHHGRAVLQSVEVYLVCVD